MPEILPGQLRVEGLTKAEALELRTEVGNGAKVEDAKLDPDRHYDLGASAVVIASLVGPAIKIIAAVIERQRKKRKEASEVTFVFTGADGKTRKVTIEMPGSGKADIASPDILKALAEMLGVGVAALQKV